MSVATHSELNAWLMPSTARKEWLRLAEALSELPDDEVPCRGGGAEAWWPEKKDVQSLGTLAAIDACRACRARIACRDYALAADERFGIWAGTLPEERRDIRLRVANTSPANVITETSRLSV